MSDPWHAYREDVFAVMRQIDDVVQHAWEQARKLGPRYGALSIGSQDFDHTLKATIGEQFLRVLRTGGDPSSAYDSAVAAGEESIEKWNTTGCLSRVIATGRFELHRNKCTAESIALGFLTRFQIFNERVSPQKKEEVKHPPVKLRRPIIDGSGYCGPTVLSSLTGLGTKQISQILRRQFAMKAVRGLTHEQMAWFIEQVGYQIAKVSYQITTVDVASRREDGLCLLELDDHWMLMSGTSLVCTQFGSAIGHVAESKYRQSRVVAVREIQGAASEDAIRKLTASPRPSVPRNQLTMF